MGISVVGTEGVLSVRYDDERKLRLCRSHRPPEDEAVYEEVPLTETRSIPGASPIDFGGLRYFSENNRFAAWDLLKAIAEDRPPLANAEDARLTLEIMNAAYASQLSGGVIPLPLADRKHPLTEK